VRYEKPPFPRASRTEKRKTIARARKYARTPRHRTCSAFRRRGRGGGGGGGVQGPRQASCSE
jgi:hypothetical protein